MEEWLRSGAAVATPLIAIAALITSIWVSQRVKRKREFEILLEENRREAAKREAETRALTERIDREAAKREERFESEVAKREAETRALTEQIDREAAKREERFESEVAKREAETRALTEQIDREAAKREERFESEATKREAAIQALFDRSDRNFEALQARSDELFRQSAGVAERVVRSETRLETLEVARPPRAADPSAPAAGETEAVAAQDVPVERHPE